MGSRIPGPACQVLHWWSPDIDDGTLQRVVSIPPGPIGVAPPTAGTASRPAQAQATIELPLAIYLVDLAVVQETEEPYEVRVGSEKRTQKRRVRKVVKSTPSGQTEEGVRKGLDRCNEIWKLADITFRADSITVKSLEHASDVVTEADFFGLITELKLPKTGLSVMFVGQFESPHLGGQAVESLGAAIVTKLQNPTLGNVLAHELGHLLGLPDLGHVPGSVVNNYNLMYGALPAAQQLTPPQIHTARTKAGAKLKPASP